MRFLSVFLALSISLFAMETAKNKPEKKIALHSELIANPLNGIYLVGSWDKMSVEPQIEKGTVSVDGVFLVTDHPSFMTKLQNEFVGRPFTQGSLWKLRSDIVDFYCSHGQPFVIVSVPIQPLAHGILQVVITEAKLDNIYVKGNRFFKPSEIRDYIRAKPGALIDSKKLVADMAAMNRNPFRRTDAILRPAKKPGFADLELATVDRFPYRFYMGADNTGTNHTDRDRLFFGLNLGKTIVDDSEISYQFTCSPNWNLFNAQTALFRVPFPARQTMIFYGGYAQSKPELPKGDHEKSYSWQVDGRYRIPIITNTKILQEFILGYDYKQVKSRIKKDDVEIFDNNAAINQFMAGYDLGYRTPWNRITLVAEVYGGIGGMSHGNTSEKFEAFRTGAGPWYVYGKLSHSFGYRFGHFWFSYDLNGQLSSKNLLPSEQFCLSGYNAVRGFEERVVSVDNALLLNVTLQSPRFSISKLAGWTKRSFDELYFLGFFDFGYGGNTNPLIGESRTKSLGSIGPGVRYQIDRYLTARFDYGFQLWHHGFDNPTHSRYNFGLIVSF